MAEGNEASFSRIGAFIVAGVLLIAGTLVYLGGWGGERSEYLVETYFSNDVSGLDVGSAVNFRGVRVGAVKAISFIGAEYENVSSRQARNIYVLLALDPRLFRMDSGDGAPSRFVAKMVENGLHATVSSSGITGLSRIELNFPKNEIEDETLSWQPRNLFIPPAPSMLETAADSASKVLRQLNGMDLALVWSNVVRFTDSAAGLCENAGGMLETERGRISSILDNLESATSSLKEFAETVRDNPSLLLRSRDAEPLDETRR